MGKVKKDIKQVLLSIRNLELDFKKDFEELKSDKNFWKEVNKIYVPEALCQIYGPIEITGDYTIKVTTTEKGERKSVEYELYGHRDMEDGENIMVFYEEV